MKIDTSQYRAVHGHNPRGTGPWVFEITKAGFVGDEIIRFGSYTDAKYAAKRTAQALDLDTVIVQPQSICHECPNLH